MDATEWNNLYISDSTGGKFFKTTASPMSTVSEIKNLKAKIKQAKQMPNLYKFLDVPTAFIVMNGKAI